MFQYKVFEGPDAPPDANETFDISDDSDGDNADISGNSTDAIDITSDEDKENVDPATTAPFLADHWAMVPKITINKCKFKSGLRH